MVALQHAVCVVLFACLVVLGDGYDNQLRVAAFNIKSLGVTKMNKPEVVDVLKKIITRYDITLIQEIRDNTGKAIKKLLSAVNGYGIGVGLGTWEMLLSDRLGSTRYKEQYAYFYNTRRVSVVDTYQWEDTSFERPPFIVRFKVHNNRNRASIRRKARISGEINRRQTLRGHEQELYQEGKQQRIEQRNLEREASRRREIQVGKQKGKPKKNGKQLKQRRQRNQRKQPIDEFGFIGIHVQPIKKGQPKKAVNEIDRLVDVYNITAEMWNLQDFIIGGDFNAGCAYVRAHDWNHIRLRTDEHFAWVTTDNIDTTTNPNTNCPYDRLVLAGTSLQDAYVTGSAKIYDFARQHGLDSVKTEAVSDHYPVEMLLD